MINTYDFTLMKLIVEKDYLFEVPNYQRSYVWLEKEVAQFLRDGTFCLKKYVSPNDKFEHYAGQMIFRSVRKERDGRERLEIIDGQQRLTTFMILVAASSDILNQQGESMKGEKLREKYLNLMPLFNKGLVEKRLTLSKKDSDFWNNLIDGFYYDRKDLNLKLESQNRIWNAYLIINKYLLSLLDRVPREEQGQMLGKYIEALAESFRVVVLTTENPGHEFALFQIVNDRGIPLTPGELLKARTIELLTSQKKEFKRERIVRRAEEIWEDILTDAGDMTERFLVWNYIAILGKSPEPLKKNPINEQYERNIFYSEGKREISMDMQDELLKQLEQLYENVQICRCLVMGNFPVKRASNNLNLLLGILIRNMKNFSSIPLYLKILSLNKEKKALSLAEKMTPMLVKTYFITKIMGNLNDESITNCYLKIWGELEAENVEIDKIKQNLQALLLKDKSEIEFWLKINHPVYSRGAANIKSKFLLLMAELQYSKENENGSASYGDDSVEILFDQLSVEHILFEGVNEDSVSKDFYESIHRIGNLTLLGARLNSRERAKDFQIKKEHYCNSPYHITREVGKLKNWNYNAFKKRQVELMDILHRAFEP